MNDRAVIRGLIRQGAQINIIGDSLAAGAGSSDSYSTEEVILHDGEDVFVRRAAPNSWWSRLQNYIDDKYPGCTVVNNGCGGAFSFQLKNHLPSVFQEDKDDIIFLFLGANDRKRVNGMDELRSNLTWMIRYFKGKNKPVAVFTPNPSTAENESYKNRLYHLEDVANTIIDVAEAEDILIVDNYNYIMDYLLFTGKKIDDIIFGKGCRNDGLHPSDKVQEMIYHNLMRVLGFSVKTDGAVWK